MPVINGVYLKDFTALPSSVTDANIIPIAITGNQIAYRTTVAGIVTDARVTGKLLTGLSVTGGAIAATDTILAAFGKVQNQINGKQGTITLTTTGTSGASTLISNTLNIPNYGSALTGYVPYTGATTDVDLGAFKLNAQSLHVKGTAGNGHLGLKHQSSSATASASESSLFADTNGDMSFQNANLYLNKFVTSANSANRTYTFPDATGTVALVGGSGVGTVTSVAALTLGTTGSDLSSTVANGTTTPVITLQVPTASAANRGALSSADWTTFNSKAAALSGTINTIAYWDSSTTIASLALATYPSLTELSYVKGVTSAIQTQLNAKQATITLTTTGTSGAATFSSNTLNIPNYADGGVLSLSAIGGTANANAATITGTVLNLQPADASFGGVVTTGTQTFAGDKTLTGTLYGIGLSMTGTVADIVQGTATSGKALRGTATTGWGLYASATTGVGVQGNSSGTGGSGVFGSSVNGYGGDFYNDSTTYPALLVNNNNESAGDIAIFQLGGSNIFTVASGNSTFNTTVTGSSFIPASSTVPTNGMYLSAANTLNFATNTTNRLSIASTGAATFSSSVTATGLTVSLSSGAIARFSSAIAALGTTSIGLGYTDGSGGHDMAKIFGQRINDGSGRSSLILAVNAVDNDQSATVSDAKITISGTTGGITLASALTGTSATFSGAVSKGSGSFRIEHPLPSLSETHQLVHSFIEGPKADLIYRGKLVLVNGKAQANIDDIATMTEGTFEVLCRDVQCFTTNESGWDLIKGKVIGNIIYIESQNEKSTDEISWMVIGERKDKHMMETEWTDENGKVIVEPLKPIEPEPMKDLTEVQPKLNNNLE